MIKKKPSLTKAKNGNSLSMSKSPSKLALYLIKQINKSKIGLSQEKEISLLVAT